MMGARVPVVILFRLNVPYNLSSLWCHLWQNNINKCISKLKDLPKEKHKLQQFRSVYVLNKIRGAEGQGLKKLTH